MGEIKLREMIKFLCFSLLVLLLLSGCNSNDRNINNDIFQFKDSFVGDNSAVGNIVNQLPGAEQLNGFELKTNEEPYGIILNYDWIESEQEYKDTVAYNVTFLFTLVQNVDWITLNSDIGKYTITKENLQEWYGKELSEVQNEDELRELIQEYLEEENKVNQLLKVSVKWVTSQVIDVAHLTLTLKVNKMPSTQTLLLLFQNFFQSMIFLLKFSKYNLGPSR